MKKLRIIVAVMLVLGMVLAFGACGQKTTEEPAATDSSAASETPATAEKSVASEEPVATDEATETKAAAEGGTLIMSTNAAFPPYEYYEGTDIVGIDAEIAGLIAEKLGMALQIEDMEFDSVVTSVSTGKTDIAMAGLTITEDRLKSVNFSTSYATGKQVIIVSEDSAITGPDDLKDKKIGVQLSTTGDIYCSDDYGDDAVERFNKGADAVQALMQGKVDAVVIDSEPAKVFVSQKEGLKILETEYVTEEYAIAIAKDNTDLLDKVNAALAELTESGQIQVILDKYISAE